MKKRLKMLSMAGLLASSSLTLAATDGDLSTTSSEGSTRITAEVPKMVRITGLQDLDLGKYDPANHGDLYATTKFCVYRNSHGGTFEMQMRGDGAGSWQLAAGCISAGQWRSR